MNKTYPNYSLSGLNWVKKINFNVTSIYNFDIRWICDTSEEFAQQDPCLYSGCYATNCQLQIG